MADQILLVDDEPNVLHALQRQLRGRYTVHTATSGEAIGGRTTMVPPDRPLPT